MSDLISRQTAIDALDKRFDDVPMELTTEILQLRHDLRERIPSAQPATNCSEIPNSSDDTISRQAAIDALAKFVPYAICDESTESYANGLTDAYNLILQLPSTQPEQRWIPCSERLPEENGQYLITVRYKHVDGYEDVYAEHGDWCDGNWDMFCFGHCGEVESISAWMPLPDPYKGGDSE